MAEKDRRIHLGVDELSDELIKFAKEEFGVSRETLFSLEEDEEMRQKLLDIWGQIEIDELPGDDSPVPEYVQKVSDLLTAICYHPRHLEVSELSDEVIKFAEEEFGVSREVLLNIEEDEEMWQKLLDIWGQIETDGIPGDGSPVPEYVRKVSELLDAIC